MAGVLSAFWQLPVAEDHIERTAFVTPSSKFCFNRMPFGVANAPLLFQHTMSLTLGHLGLESGILSYMDDIVCMSSTFDAHLRSLEQMFHALQNAGLTLKPSKVQFGQREISCLGHTISERGTSISSDRIAAIQQLPRPTYLKELLSILGTLNFVRRFVRDYADLTAPLVELTRKDFDVKKRFQTAWGKSITPPLTESARRCLPRRFCTFQTSRVISRSTPTRLNTVPALSSRNLPSVMTASLTSSPSLAAALPRASVNTARP